MTEPAFLLAALDSLPTGALILNQEGVVCWANAEWGRLTGYAAAELVGRFATSFVSGMPDTDFSELLRKVIRSETPWSGEAAWRTKSGDLYIAEQTVTPVRRVTGEVSHLMVVTRDLTVRKLVLESLLASDFWLRQSHRIAGVGSYVLDVTSGLWTSSETLDGIFGIGPDYRRDVEGWANLIHPEQRQELVDYFQNEVLGLGKPFNREYQIIRHNDGQSRSVHGLGELVFNDAGIAVKMLGTIQDITDRKAVEEALRESEHRYRAVFESSRDALFIADSETGLLVDANPAAQALIGRSVEEIRTCHFTQLHPPEEQLAARANFERDRRVPGVTEHVVLRSDGKLVPVEIAANRMRGAGAGELILGAFRDITERKREQQEREGLEEHLRQSQKLESIGRLTGGVAHEFNNLLTVVNGYSEFLLQAMSTQDPLRRYVEQILKAGEHGSSLTAQLLAFSRKQVIQSRPIDLNAVVKDAEQLLQRLVGEDIELVTILEPSLGQVVADPIQIHQVLMNLASNARDAMPDGGKLIIETANVKTGVTPTAEGSGKIPGESVLLKVTDTGIGMSDQTRNRIFEPFFTTKEQGKGTGLGLATIHGIIHQIGGWIEVETQPGRGTSFAVHLPRTNDTVAEEHTEAAVVPAPGSSATILLVEDQDAVRGLVKTVLLAEGYHVLDAADGAEALALADKHPAAINLLISDLLMPRMNGRELADKLKIARPQTKVLFISGHTSEVIAHDHPLASGVSFMPKPFSPAALAAKVKELLAEG